MQLEILSSNWNWINIPDGKKIYVCKIFEIILLAGMILVEHFSPLCERKVEPAPAVSEEGGT